MTDVLVLGAGPAGLAAAAALAARGLRVAVAAPDLVDDRPPTWAPTYCAWADELDPIGFGDVVDRRWESVEAAFGADRVHTLDRAYVRVDKARLAARLYAAAHGVSSIRGAVDGAVHTPTHSAVRVGGATVDATVVVDATGHRPALLRVDATPPPAFQTAIGRVVAPADPPWRADRAVLMDYTPLDPDAAPATFLYVLPLGDGRFFVEETVLAARPALDAAALRARLDRRLAALGVAPVAAADEEWVSIPMGGALPADPRVLGFGAAAGMIHPASGYLLPRVLGGADRLADAVATALGAPGATPAAAVAAGWAAVWPRDLRQRRALYRFGLEALLGMDPVATRAFFDGFFRLPTADWAGYLSDRHAAPALRQVMWTLFAGVSPGLKWRLARAGFGREGLALLTSTLGP